MKTRKEDTPLGLLIVGCLIVIGLLGLILILNFGDEPWLSTAGYLVAASTIAIGGCVAYRHLRIIQGTERAEVLTSLDNCWYSSLADARSEFIKFKNSLKSPNDSPEYGQEIISRLQTMKKDKPDTYRTLAGMLDFYETLGYFSRVGYILLRDVKQIYGPSVREYDEMFRKYVLGYQSIEKDKSIYENFIWLTDELKKQYD